MRIEDFIKRVQKRSLESNGFEWYVIYGETNDTITKIDDKELRLYSLQAYNNTWLTVNFMVKGEKIMYCYDSYLKEKKFFPVRNGGIEYRCFPITEDIIDIILALTSWK